MEGSTPLKPRIIAENSFERNQSFPVISKHHQRRSYGVYAKGVENLTGEEYDSYSYRHEQCFANRLQRSGENINVTDENFKNESPLSSARDDKRALLTVCKEDGMKILTINKRTSDFLGFTPAEIVGRDIRDLFKNPSNKDLLDNEHHAVFFPTSGKIVDVISKQGFPLAVTVWTKNVEDCAGKQCLIVVLEPVERVTCFFDFNDQGDISYCDEKFSIFHGLQANDMEGMSVKKLMPSYILPLQDSCAVSKDIRLQHTTSKMSDGTNFPVSILIMSQQKTERTSSEKRSVMYSAKMWIFPHVSGLITTKSSGEIQSVNNNFARYLFGYSAEEMAGMNITDLIEGLLYQSKSGSLYNSTVPQIEMDSSLNFSCQENEKTTEDGSTIESWVEVSLMSNEANEKNHSAEKGNTGSHDDFLRKVNALLNNSGGVLNNSADICTQRNDHTLDQRNSSNKCYKEASAHSDSAIHSTCSSCKCKPPLRHEEKDSARSSFSDYHSADGSRNVVSRSGHEIHQLNNEDLPSPQHEHSSFMVLENDGSEQVFSVASENHRERIDPSDKMMKTAPRLTLRSEVTSTPLECGRALSRISNPDAHFQYLQEGFHKARYKHKHGAMIEITYELTKVATKSKSEMFCFRIYAETTPVENYSAEMVNSTMQTTVSTLPSLSLSNRSSLLDSASSCDSQVEKDLFEDESKRLAIDGEFGQKFTLVKQIGCGAFGFVQIAKCKQTSTEFVVKFIRKEKILDECWVHDEEFDAMIPLEIALLTGFSHPNIIRVVEFFENKSYFSMIMPKHGIHSLDLFEFIDRSNNGVDRYVGEPLASYIFRQVASAVSYLHAHSILHRDIKDENIIIDEKFTCKLIDFGSATFMKPGLEFATFCGTIEYCSPEVLMGNKYRGPELEMWALGVTLYTLIFGENPFKNVEETVECAVDPPFAVTRDLAVLLQSLLRPDPDLRCTIGELLESPWLNQHINVEEYSWKDVVRTPAVSLNSSVAEINQQRKDASYFDEENLCHEVEKLTTTATKHQGKQNRQPLVNLNNTI